MSMKNSSDIIGNRTRDLPPCSPVSQITAPPRYPYNTDRGVKWENNFIRALEILIFKTRNLLTQQSALRTAFINP